MAKNEVFDPTPRKASDALKDSHEVPVTKEAGVCEHLDHTNRDFAEQYLRGEESRIQNAFDQVHSELEEVQNASQEANARHAGFTRNPLTPVTPKTGVLTEYENR